ncbi:MAG TPA: hypothetical protein VGB83_04230 [Actinomycetota bacterium]
MDRGEIARAVAALSELRHRLLAAGQHDAARYVLQAYRQLRRAERAVVPTEAAPLPGARPAPTTDPEPEGTQQHPAKARRGARRARKLEAPAARRAPAALPDERSGRAPERSAPRRDLRGLPEAWRRELRGLLAGPPDATAHARRVHRIANRANGLARAYASRHVTGADDRSIERVLLRIAARHSRAS